MRGERRILKNPASARGGALIVALLAVALVTASATWLLRNQSLVAGHAETTLSLAQGKQLLLAGGDWALMILAEDARNSTIDHEAEVWATRLPPSEAEGWEIEGRIEDAQSRFNLNSLVRNGQASQTDLEVFVRLLATIGASPALARSLADWIDEDGNVSPPDGAEDATYLTRALPYRAANRPLVELAGLTRVQGFSPALIARLQPLVTALPRPSAINLNTASPELLVAGIPGLALGEAKQLVERRRLAPFASVSDFQSRLPRKELLVPAGVFSVKSNYFRVFGTARADSKKIGLEALVYRDDNARPRVVWRKES